MATDTEREPSAPFAQGDDDQRPEWMQWVEPGSVGHIVSKIQRAQRNNTGVAFTPQQVRDLLEIGAAETIMRAELEEMKQTARASTLAARNGNRKDS